MRKVCVFTGTRAEYGILRPLLRTILQKPELHLQLLVSGMHLSPEFGLTVREIEGDGFSIDERVEMLLSSDTPLGTVKSAALGLMGIAEAIGRLAPDILVLLGDRFEAFAAAAAAYLLGVPVAHLHGGEVTEGAVDEGLRHAVTKMSALHFTATEEYRRRVIQLGEDPSAVFNVGALGVEEIRHLPLLSRPELEKSLGVPLGERSVLVTFHPVTQEAGSAKEQIGALLEALDRLPLSRILFTKANADAEGRLINALLEEYVASRPEKASLFASLGQLRYLSAIRHCEAVIGNSSSGLIEAPSLGIPTVNIGNRQKGRVRGASVIDCEPAADTIEAACRRALTEEFKKIARTADNPYYRVGTAERIAEILQTAELLRPKIFFDLPAHCFKGLS